MIADYRTAPIDEKLRATLAFLEKVTRSPATVVASDARAVLDAGVTPKGIEDALYVAALRFGYEL